MPGNPFPLADSSTSQRARSRYRIALPDWLLEWRSINPLVLLEQGLKSYRRTGGWAQRTHLRCRWNGECAALIHPTILPGKGEDL